MVLRAPISKDAGEHALCILDRVLALALVLQVLQIPAHCLRVDFPHRGVPEVRPHRGEVLVVGVHRAAPDGRGIALDVLLIRYRHHSERVAVHLRRFAFHFVQHHSVLVFVLCFGLGLSIENLGLRQPHRPMNADAFFLLFSHKNNTSIRVHFGTPPGKPIYSKRSRCW